MKDLTGERLGPFEIEALLGVGGFATVYRAFDPRLKADVAVKILAENHSLNPDVRDRFLREALALRRVDSPSVIDIHDIRETPQGQPFLVLEYADRGDLLQRRQDKAAGGWQPRLGDVRSLVEVLGEALEAIHLEQLVHRDVTPANLLIRSVRKMNPERGVTIIEPDERILLSDMGLAKDLTDGSGLTLGGGTAGFAAPEQSDPLVKVDSRTDIYAASAVVVWFLTGQVVSVQPKWPESLNSAGWPPGLIESLSQGLADDPDERPSSMAQWQELLSAALTTPVARPLSTETQTLALRKAQDLTADQGVNRSIRSSSKSKGRYLLGGLVAVALLAGGVAFVPGIDFGDASGRSSDGVTNNSVVADGTDLDDTDTDTGTGTGSENRSVESDNTSSDNTGSNESSAEDIVTADDATEGKTTEGNTTEGSTTKSTADEETTAGTELEVSGELVVGYDETVPDLNRQRPQLYEPAVDPAYGTRITRLNSADSGIQQVDTNALRQTENADGSLLLTFHGESKGFEVRRRDDGSLVQSLDFALESAPSWNPTDPNRLRYLVLGELKLRELDVTSGSSVVLVDLTDRIQAEFPEAVSIYPRKGGAASADGSRHAWYVFGTGENPLGAITYDLSTDTLVGALPFANFPNSGRPLSIAVSSTGDYVVTVQEGGTYVHDAELGNSRLIFAGNDPGDLAINSSGVDSYAYINYGDGWLNSVDLETLTTTRILNLFQDANTQIDLSGRGYAKPGWVVASTHDCKLERAWSCHKVMAIEMQPDGRVMNLAHTYSCTTAGWYQPQAVPNRDFSRVYFSSDNGSCDTDAELMVIDVPPFD